MMLNGDQKLKLYTLLLNARGDKRLSLRMVAMLLEVPVATTREKNALRYQIRKLRKLSEFEYLANTGTGYFIPEFEEEFVEVHEAFKNRANGLAETANKFKSGAIKAKKAPKDHEQITIDDVNAQ